jgi:hypothetical protein
MLEAMALIAPSQPSEMMARIASRRNGTISRETFFGRRFDIVLEGSNTFKKRIGLIGR